MDEVQVEDLLDNIREHVVGIREDSECLADSIYPETTDVDDELEALIQQRDEEEALEVEEALPTAPLRTTPAEEEEEEERASAILVR